jgi:archaellum component FlaC
LLKKENEILDQRQNLITAQKENLKLKSDREKLSKICAELRKEINRLENNIKNLQKESLEDDEENLKENDELLYYETPQIMSQNLVPNAMFNSNFYQKDSDNVDEDKIKFYSEQIEKLKSQSKDIENKFKFSK